MTKSLFDAVQDIIEIVRSSSGSQSDPWKEIVNQCKPPGVIDANYCTPVEKAIEAYISEIGEEDKREIWTETEVGQMHLHEAESIHIGSIEMDLSVALLQEVMHQAFYEAGCKDIS
ncbi:MAG: hypothetical protein GTN82_14410 [Candidatus Aminicenantes bacterium]|nr:hypothetical protein [Candidatus Aminicenantes bacterium]